MCTIHKNCHFKMSKKSLIHVKFYKDSCNTNYVTKLINMTTFTNFHFKHFNNSNILLSTLRINYFSFQDSY